MKMIFCAFMVTSVIFNVFIVVKSFNTLNNHSKILSAIDAYTTEIKDYENGLLLIDNMESFNQTLFRFWDWGYTRILPKEDYEWIKPYIKEKQR